VTSEDCAAPPAQVPEPPSTPTVCTTPPSLCEIPASGPTPLDPPPLPLDPAPELDEPPEVELLLEPDDPLEPPDVPELEPLELVALPDEEAAASLSGEPSLVELPPHAPAITTRHTRHPVIAERGRTPVLAVSMFTPSLSRSGSHRRNPSRKVGMLERSSGDRQIRSGCRGRTAIVVAKHPERQTVKRARQSLRSSNIHFGVRRNKPQRVRGRATHHLRAARTWSSLPHQRPWARCAPRHQGNNLRANALCATPCCARPSREGGQVSWLDRIDSAADLQGVGIRRDVRDFRLQRRFESHNCWRRWRSGRGRRSRK